MKRQMGMLYFNWKLADIFRHRVSLSEIILWRYVQILGLFNLAISKYFLKYEKLFCLNNTKLHHYIIKSLKVLLNWIISNYTIDRMSFLFSNFKKCFEMLELTALKKNSIYNSFITITSGNGHPCFSYYTFSTHFFIYSFAYFIFVNYDFRP